MFYENDTNFRSVLQGAELFERLGLFEHRWLPLHELEQELQRVTVDALVTVEFESGRRGSHERDQGPREVKRVAIPIHADLHPVRVCHVVTGLECARAGE